MRHGLWKSAFARPKRRPKKEPTSEDAGIPWRPLSFGSHGIFVYTSPKAMALFSQLVFQVVRWKARRGLREEEVLPRAGAKLIARQTGIRGETYAYWYLRRQGYVFVARNYSPRTVKGELDLVGYDGATLAFVKVRTRTVREEMTALPELSVTEERHRLLARTARRFLAERHVRECPLRFDVVASDNEPGHPPVVRLHKDAFSPQM